MNRREVPLQDSGIVPTKNPTEHIPSRNRCRGLSHRLLVSDLGQWDRRVSLNGDLRQLRLVRNKPFRQSSQPKPPRLALTDAKGCRDIAHRKPVREQFSRLQQQRRFQVRQRPANTGPNVLNASLERYHARSIYSIAQFLEMDFKSRPLLGRIVFRSPQSDHRIQSILTARRAALPAVRSGMMNQQNGDALPTQLQQPILDW